MTTTRTHARPSYVLLWIGVALLVLGVPLVASVIAGFGMNILLPAGALLMLTGIGLTVTGAVRRRP